MSSTDDTTNAGSGPLRLPHPPNPVLATLMIGRLGGHVTSDKWLPEGLTPAVDEMRVRQLAQRERLADALDALDGFDHAVDREDKQHAEALKAAQRGGSAVQDKRTAKADREAARTDLEAVLWAAVEVMAEVVAEIIEELREAEDDIMASLRERAAVSEEAHREAQRKLAEAEAVKWTVVRLGQWVTSTTDDGPFGTQPAPTLSAPPPGIRREAVANALERPWHKIRPWNGQNRASGAETPAVSSEAVRVVA